MVESRTPVREVVGSILTQVAVLCHCARYIYLPKRTGNTHEVVAPSRHDGKIVYWDVKQMKRNETFYPYEPDLLETKKNSANPDETTSI